MAKNNAPAQTFAPTVYALPPQAPAAPGLMGKYSQQAFQMAGPRVGFGQAPAAPRPFDPLDPNFNSQPASGGGPDVRPIGATPQGAGAQLQGSLNTTLNGLAQRGVPVTNVSGTRISGSPYDGGPASLGNPFINSNLSSYTSQGFAGPMGIGGSGLTLDTIRGSTLGGMNQWADLGFGSFDASAGTTGLGRVIGKLFGRGKY